jgi:hypothetical protein
MATSLIRPGKARITSGPRYWLALRCLWLAACLIDGEVEVKRK